MGFGDRDIVIRSLPNVLIHSGMPWDVYAIPKGPIGFAIEVHPVAVLVLHPPHQTLKGVPVASTRVVASAGQS